MSESFNFKEGANPKGSITAQGESRGQIYLSMTEPQPELLGCAEQPPAGRCNRSGVASRRDEACCEISLKKKNARFKEPDVHKETDFLDASDYIMPPMPPMEGSIAGAAGFGSFFSVITQSVVRIIEAIEEAFLRAVRVTLAGSITPALMRSS